MILEGLTSEEIPFEIRVCEDDLEAKKSAKGIWVCRLARELLADRKRLAAENERLRKALEHYADEKHWLQQVNAETGKPFGARCCFIPYVPEGPGWVKAYEALAKEMME